MKKSHLPLRHQVGQVIQQARKEIGYSQFRLAEILDVSVTTVQNIEHGKHFPDCASIFLLEMIFPPNFSESMHQLFQDYFSFEHPSEHLMPFLRRQFLSAALHQDIPKMDDLEKIMDRCQIKNTSRFFHLYQLSKIKMHLLRKEFNQALHLCDDKIPVARFTLEAWIKKDSQAFFRLISLSKQNLSDKKQIYNNLCVLFLLHSEGKRALSFCKQGISLCENLPLYFPNHHFLYYRGVCHLLLNGKKNKDFQQSLYMARKLKLEALEKAYQNLFLENFLEI